MLKTRKTWLLFFVLVWGALVQVFPGTTLLKPVSLTSEEKQWLEEHSSISIGIDTAWPPFEYLNKKNLYSGISSSYIQELEKNYGMEFRLVDTLAWSEVISKAKISEIDVLPCLAKSDERSKYLSFTKPYITVPMVLITKQNTHFIGNIANVEGKIAIIKGYITEEILKTAYPNKEYFYVNSTEEGLRAVSQGKADIFPGNLLAISYQMRQRSFNNLKVDGVLPYSFDLRFGVRKDWPQLVSILNKQIDATPKSIRATIEAQWVNAPIEASFNYKQFFIITLLCLLCLLLVIAYFIRRNRGLVQQSKELKRAQEIASAASIAKSAFLANMSHEIRTPMNAILGFSEILQKQETDPKKSRFLQNINTSGRSLLNLINCVLDLSKIEAGKQTLEYRKVDIPDFVKEIQVLFEQQIAKKGLKLHITIDDAVPPALLLDGPRLQQVIINLVGNALKFTTEGSITISFFIQEKTATELTLCFSVTDTGCGIPEDELDIIFVPFEQSTESTELNASGTGLGLTISKSLIELMLGTISVKSELGKGTTFTVELPHISLTDNNSEISTTPKKDVSLPPLNVLIVDDEKVNREILTLFLQDFHCTISYAQDGIEALESTKKNHPDIILLDIMMPKMNGDKVAQILKSDPKTKDIVLIAVTALALKNNEEEIRGYCDDYVVKPINREKLIQTMAKFF